MVDMKKIRREAIRWNILVTLNNARPFGAHESVVQEVIRAVYADATQEEVRRELDYLERRELVTIKHQPDGVWICELTRWGIDVAEYDVDCEPGIARPAKYY